jgi:uncharacterized RDD family membrane protein YckC
MRSRFEPDIEARPAAAPSSILIDPEAYDASEQEFAASLDQPKGRFVVDVEAQSETETETKREPNGIGPNNVEVKNAGVKSAEAQQQAVPQPPAEPSIASPSSDPGSWREEVAARLNHYRARRQPRQPRYPSLQLKFEAGEPAWSRPTPANELPPPITQQALRRQAKPEPAQEVEFEIGFEAASEVTAKIIEFPRSYTPPLPLDELAEPVCTRPRILEAPEIVPPGPALGGIQLEPAEEPPAEKRPGFEIPLQPAAMERRLAAAAIDAVIVAVALAAFAAVSLKIASLKITVSLSALPQAAGTAVLVAGLLWTIYQYLLLVCSGATPGLRLAKLQLNRFDGSPVPRSLRRWRVLASLISAVSLGLGYAWCFFDEDRLSWHDRITRTYMAPRG